MFRTYKEEVEALRRMLEEAGVPYEIRVRDGYKHGAANVYCKVWINGKEHLRTSTVGVMLVGRVEPFTKRGATYEKVKRLLQKHRLVKEEQP